MEELRVVVDPHRAGLAWGRGGYICCISGEDMLLFFLFRADVPSLFVVISELLI